MATEITGSTGITTPNIVSQLQTISTRLDLTGGQIKFPAAQVASSDPNTLDDYEEGDWTPVAVPLTGSITTQSNVGKYVKSGRNVLVTGRLRITDNGTGAGNAYITLPFHSIENGFAGGAGRVGVTTGKTCFIGVTESGSNRAFIFQYDNAYPFASGAVLDFSISYPV